MASGSFLSHPGLTQANCKRLTISGWFRLPAPVVDGPQFSSSAGGIGISSCKVRYSFWEFRGIAPVPYSVAGISHSWEDTGIVTSEAYLDEHWNEFSAQNGPIWPGNTTSTVNLPADAD